MKITIEQAPDAYVVKLMKDGKLNTVLCTREQHKDARKDARWYKDNEYPEAKLELPRFFVWLDFQTNELKYNGKLFSSREKAIKQLINTMENDNRYVRNVIKDIDDLDKQIAELEEFGFKLVEL